MTTEGHVFDRAAAAAAIWGSILMLAGAGLWVASGANLWLALATSDMVGYLRMAGPGSTLALANLSCWTLGVLLLGFAGSGFAAMCHERPVPAMAAMLCFRTGVPLAIVAFLTMMAIVVQVGSDTASTVVRISEVIGWMAARADDFATSLIIGLGPLFLSHSGRTEWVPRWLLRWGYLAGFAALLAPVSIYTGIVPLAFVIVPIGIGWMLAAGMLVRSRALQRTRGVGAR
jgi:hypothetical protein